MKTKIANVQNKKGGFIYTYFLVNVDSKRARGRYIKRNLQTILQANNAY